MLTTIQPVSAYSHLMQKQNITTQTDQVIDEKGTFSPSWYSKPTSYAQLVNWYQALEANYSQYLEVFKANELYGTGTITGGYDDYYVRITNEALGLHKPEVLFLGGPHGDETVGTIGAYWFTDWFMRMAFTDEPSPDYSKDWLQWLLNNREIYIEVSHNPYGFDHGPQRYDGNGWDLNREADMDGPESPIPSVWSSVNGKTLRAFVDNHVIRLGCDFHGGARLLLYPWGSTHSSIIGVSPITGYSYTYAPPDFYFYDASSLRLGDYIGDYGGNLDKYSIGTIPQTVGYSVKGGIGPWIYGADVVKNPVEDPYVKDETWGNYPGAGVLWLSPEMSTTKNPSESTFGNDTVARYGAEIRRIILHQTDLAQPYIRLQSGTVENNSIIIPGSTLSINWQVNGSLVVDHTSIQWGTNPDPINNPQFYTTDYDEHTGMYVGGTGWDAANNGQTSGVTYSENITPPSSGEYYFVVKAQVDQIYGNVLRPDIYRTHPYLRIVKERTNASYYEELEGTDGTEIIEGQTWWYSPIIHVSVTSGNTAPNKPDKPSGQERGKTGQTYTYTTSTTDTNGDQVYYMWNWGDGNFSEWLGPYNSGVEASAEKSWSVKGKYSVLVKAKDASGSESAWSDPLSITMPTSKGIQMMPLLQQFLQNLLQFLQNLMKYKIKAAI
jgi:Zinc carboxypeptidase/PKD domain